MLNYSSSFESRRGRDAAYSWPARILISPPLAVQGVVDVASLEQ